jgi:hypothetical protein
MMANGRELLQGMELLSELPNRIIQLCIQFLDRLQPCIGKDEISGTY